MVPLFDPKPQHRRVADRVEKATREVLESGQYVLGPNVQAFEKECADYHGMAHSVGVASGTDALHLALRAVGVGPGDEVITSPFSFFAGVETILYCGAHPVFGDIDPQTMNLDEESIEALVTERTRAIMPVHIFGLPQNMERIMSVARRHDLRVIEDCAQAFGGRYGKQPVGSFGDAGCFSFFPTKNLGGYGDGGLITTNNDDIARHLLSLRNHGSHRRYHHDEVGYNSRLDEIQAAALRVKLEHLDEFNDQRREIAALYDEGLADLPVQRPQAPADCHHVYGQYTLQVPKRDAFREGLEARGIGSAVYYPIPLHRQAVFGDTHAELSLPECERVSEACVSLPMFPGMSGEQADTVIRAVREVIQGLDAA